MNDKNKLNRIKIRDLCKEMRKGINKNNAMDLLRLELIARMEARALEKASDKDVDKIKDEFIRRKLGIIYYPSQNRKVLKDGKVVNMNA